MKKYIYLDVGERFPRAHQLIFHESHHVLHACKRVENAVARNDNELRGRPLKAFCDIVRVIFYFLY